MSIIRQVVSKKVNFSVKNIGAAQISGLETGLNQAQIEYFFSNDGGNSWQETDLGQIVKFDSQGNDLQWKIKILPFKEVILKQAPLSSLY